MERKITPKRTQESLNITLGKASVLAIEDFTIGLERNSENPFNALIVPRLTIGLE